MTDTKKIGNVTEMECMLQCMKLGYQVSIPFGEDCRYDFILDVNGKLYRIQSKHSSPIYDEDGNVSAIQFKTVRQSGNQAQKWKRIKYAKDEIDFFATSYDGKCYLVPVQQCSNVKTLRANTPKNNQNAKVSFMSDYELSEVCKAL